MATRIINPILKYFLDKYFPAKNNTTNYTLSNPVEANVNSKNTTALQNKEIKTKISSISKQTKLNLSYNNERIYF